MKPSVAVAAGAFVLPLALPVPIHAQSSVGGATVSAKNLDRPGGGLGHGGSVGCPTRRA
jgi:hypothetical protein